MSEFVILEEAPLTMVELKEQLATIGTEEIPLSFRGQKTKAYLESFVDTDAKETLGYVEQIEALQIPRLKPRHVVKILDVMPKDLDSLRMVFSNETITIKEEDLKKILNVIPQ
jgi:DNA-directed RNA polymerase subunit F